MKRRAKNVDFDFDGYSIAGSVNSGLADSSGRTYTLSGTTLTISKGTDVLTINNFHNGDFGVLVAGQGYYYVQPGDTWSSIINTTGFRAVMTAAQLQKLNATLGVTSLTAGTLVYMPFANSASLSSTPKLPASIVSGHDPRYPRFTMVYDPAAGQYFASTQRAANDNFPDSGLFAA